MSIVLNKVIKFWPYTHQLSQRRQLRSEDHLKLIPFWGKGVLQTVCIFVFDEWDLALILRFQNQSIVKLVSNKHLGESQTSGSLRQVLFNAGKFTLIWLLKEPNCGLLREVIV